MNDRFKFRVWDKQDECYAYSNNSDVDMLYLETDGTLTYGVWNGDIEDMFYTPESEVVIEQCTGLKDKNGKLIYEGDILKNGKHIYPVEWCVNGFAVNDGYDYLVDNEEWEVIGNIHENTDLIKVGGK